MTTSTDHIYPVHVAAHLDPALSRWLWLVKWLLAIPHYLVLALLWVAFAVLSVVAFFAILFTGRYPRGIFDFNVGVLRWTWRVAYYAYGALATDRYPPFSLQDRPDYPAHLDIDYPEHLSRGLVLVKWWLLAIPHYLVLALFLGSAGYAIGDTDSASGDLWLWSSGLLGLLVLVAAVVLLFTGRYPRAVFDFVLGMNRWVLRVAAYVALMTDEYPPFRLDQGGNDPGTAVLGRGPATVTPPPGSPGSAPTTPSGAPGLPSRPGETGTGWTAGRVVGLVVASLLALASLGITAGGAALLAADSWARDDAGFVMSGEQELATRTYALTSESMEIRLDGAAGIVPERWLGDARLTVDSDRPVFLGVAATRDVEAYLAGVRHETVGDLVVPPVYRLWSGGRPTATPGTQDFWVAQVSGSGQQELTWQVEDGDWTVVVMNADASPSITAGLAAGAELPALSWLVAVLLSVGLTGLVVSAVWLTLLVRAASRR